MTKAALLLLLLLSGCAGRPAMHSDAGRSPILHYVRSNIDGSEPEHVVQYRPDRRSISVYKWVSKCTSAAYVTARMNEEVTEGEAFVAGKVARDGSQASFGTLKLDPAASELAVDLTPPGGTRIEARHRLRSRPFILYDFDLADLNARSQETRPATAFAYDLTVIWPEGASMFRDLGRLHASPTGKVIRRGGRSVRHFTLKLDGPTTSVGDLWIDLAAGYIVEARLGVPNHPGYDDFRLTLERAETGGAAAWRRLTASHYAGCESEARTASAQTRIGIRT